VLLIFFFGDLVVTYIIQYKNYISDKLVEVLVSGSDVGEIIINAREKLIKEGHDGKSYKLSRKFLIPDSKI
jgi:hypothetical protein